MWGLVLESDLASPSTQPVTWPSCERNKETTNNDTNNESSLDSSMEPREDDKHNIYQSKRERAESSCTVLESILERRQRTRCKQLSSQQNTLLTNLEEGNNNNRTSPGETKSELCSVQCHYNRNGIKQPANDNCKSERDDNKRECNRMEHDTRLATYLEKWENEAICLYRSIQQRIEEYNKTKASHTEQENDQNKNVSNNNDNNNNEFRIRESTQSQSAPSSLFLSSDMLLFQFAELQALVNVKQQSSKNNTISSNEHISVDSTNESYNCQETNVSSDNNTHVMHKRPYLLQFYLQMEMLNSESVNNNNKSDIFLCAETIASWFVQNEYLESLYSSQCTKLTGKCLTNQEKHKAINENTQQTLTDFTGAHAIPRELLGDVALTLLLTGKITTCNTFSEWLVRFVDHVIDALNNNYTWPSTVHDVIKWALVDDVRHVVYLVYKNCVVRETIQENKQEQIVTCNNNNNNNNVNNKENSCTMLSFSKQKDESSYCLVNCAQQNLLYTNTKLTNGEYLPLAVFSTSLAHALEDMTNYVEHEYNLWKTQEEQNELPETFNNKEYKTQKKEEEEHQKEFEVQLHKCEWLLCLCFLIKQDTRFACHEILNGGDISYELQSNSDIIRHFLYTRKVAMSKVIELMAKSQQNNYLLMLYALFNQILE